MMKLRILLLNLLVVYTIHFMAQESYSNDVTCMKADDNIAVITASGTAEKKKDVYNMALKSIFNAIFLNGIDGVENGQPLVGKEDSYYMNQFFSSRYMLFVKNYETVGDPVRQSSKLYNGTVTAQILLGALKKDLIRNKLMTRPQEEMSMEETRQQIALPTIMVVPYKSNDRSSYADILKNDFDLRIAVSTVKEGFVKLGVKTVAAEGKQSGTLRASEWESKNADSNDKQLLMNSGADVYVIVDLQKDISAASGSRVSLIMTARETATGVDLASRKSWTNRFRTTDVDKLCAYAAQDVLDGFLKDISKEFARKVQQGNTVVLRVSLADNAINTMNSRINGSTTLSAHIRNWVRKNAQGGRYHIQGAVDDSLIFDSIQIPAKDSDGLPMDCITFADNLVNYLNDSGIDSGIGMAEISEGDYQQKAKQNALSDLVSEIQVVIAANSLLNTLEDDGNVKQTFAESIRTEARAEIENFRLVDSWRSDNEYWVYYELNKDDYAALNQELFCSYEGKTINLATELYAALAGVFDGITIVLNPATVSATPFQGIREPIAIGVYRNGNPLRNIRLKAEFVSGSGDLSSMSPTDESGVAALYVRNITSKQAQQEIGISLIDDVFSLFRKGSYAALFKQMLSSLPGATLTVNTAQTQTSAYVRSAQSDIETVERTVKSLLNNHFFNVVASPSEADIIVTLDNKCRKGNTVPGELYNFIEFFSTLGIKIENNRTGQILLNYSINDERTLVPENKSASQGKNMAARELIKRLNREFARELKKITFDRTGKIPERQKMLPDVPVPVVGASVPEKEADPVISVPVVVPEVIPAPLVPVKSAKPENQKAIRVEWLDGVFVEFDKLATLGDKSRIHLKIVNTNADDCEVDLYSGNLTVINEKGEESPIVSVKLGSKFNDRRVTALIVPDLPTEMVIEVSKLQSVALLQLKDFKNNIVKLRGLK